MRQNKLSGYQKLKKENQELMAKLLVLVNAPNSVAALEIKTEMRIIQNTEIAVWAGDMASKQREGLLK